MSKSAFDIFCNSQDSCNECRYSDTKTTNECKAKFNSDIGKSDFNELSEKLDKIILLLNEIINK